MSPEILADTEQPVKAPSNLNAVLVSPRQIDLTWVDNSSNETGFRLERSQGPDFKEGLIGYNLDPDPRVGVTISLSDRTVTPDLVYYYRVFAMSREEKSAPSNIVQISNIKPPAAADLSQAIPSSRAAGPAAPANLQATVVNSTQVILRLVGQRFGCYGIPA